MVVTKGFVFSARCGSPEGLDAFRLLFFLLFFLYSADHNHRLLIDGFRDGLAGLTTL